MLPPVRVHHPHVVIDPRILDGSPVVRGSVVPVRRLWAWHRKGVTVATLWARYPSLSHADVLDALAFAYDNEDLIEADLDRERAIMESHRNEDPRPSPSRT